MLSLFCLFIFKRFAKANLLVLSVTSQRVFHANKSCIIFFSQTVTIQRVTSGDHLTFQEKAPKRG